MPKLQKMLDSNSIEEKNHLFSSPSPSVKRKVERGSGEKQIT